MLKYITFLLNIKYLWFIYEDCMQIIHILKAQKNYNI